MKNIFAKIGFTTVIVLFLFFFSLPQMVRRLLVLITPRAPLPAKR